MESAGEKEATRIVGMRMRYGNKNIIGGEGGGAWILQRGWHMQGMRPMACFAAKR